MLFANEFRSPSLNNNNTFRSLRGVETSRTLAMRHEPAFFVTIAPRDDVEYASISISDILTSTNLTSRSQNNMYRCGEHAGARHGQEVAALRARHLCQRRLANPGSRVKCANTATAR
jgi:hypothetical protein